MSGDLLTFAIPYTAVMVLIDAIMVYSAYLALSVRRGLADPTYRGRALWTALFTLLVFVSFTYAGVLHVLYPLAPTNGFSGSQAGSISSGAGADFIFAFLAIVAYAWIDRTMAAMIRLDFLRRDVLGWKRFRPGYWGMVVCGFGAYFGSYYVAPLLGLSAGGAALVLAAFLLIVPLIYASLSLTTGGRRTADMTFRTHAKWFGLFVMAFVGIFGLYAVGVGPLPTSVLFLAAAYCLYKMAKHLVPVSRFPGA